MKARYIVASVLALSFVASASEAKTPAKGEKLIGCYDKVLVPAEYDVKHKLVEPATRKYVKRNGRIELWEYAAVYEEIKTLIKDEYFVMKQISCK